MAMDLKELDNAPDPARHWYYHAKAALLLRSLRGKTVRHALDVGAGSGFFSKTLLERGLISQAICVDTNYPGDLEERVGNGLVAYRRKAVKTDADLVLMMDVIEHVEDATGFIRDHAALAGPNATFVLTVPAFSWIYSNHDKFLGHYRRYTLRELEATARAAGLTVLAGHYYYGSIFPIIAVWRLLDKYLRPERATSDLTTVTTPLNALLEAVLAAELPLARFNRLFGVTAVCLAKGPAHQSLAPADQYP
jgi:2-polyprenyl-3-methyl-5-hydroxy-6-metoxy-1,4-benzoquinol methylase